MHDIEIILSVLELLGGWVGLNPLDHIRVKPYSSGKFQPPRGVAATPLAHITGNEWFAFLSHVHRQRRQPPCIPCVWVF